MKTAVTGGVGSALLASSRKSDPGQRIEVMQVSEIELSVDNTDSHEKIAAVIATSPPMPAALVSDIRSEQILGIVKKLAGRHIEAHTMTLREGARSDFAGMEMVLIIPDVGSHSDIDAVIAAAEKAGKKWKTISRKSSQWDLSIADTSTFAPAVSRSLMAAEAVLDRAVNGMKADGNTARILTYLTEGVREYVFLAGAAKARIIEEKYELLGDEIRRLQQAIEQAKCDDEAAHALFTETESQLAELRSKYDEVCRKLEEKEETARLLMERVQQAEHEARCRGQERDDALELVEARTESARRFEKAATELSDQIVTERNAHIEKITALTAEHNRLLAAAEARAPNSVPVSGTDPIRRVVEAALGAVEAGLLSHEEALSRIATIARRPS